MKNDNDSHSGILTPRVNPTDDCTSCFAEPEMKISHRLRLGGNSVKVPPLMSKLLTRSKFAKAKRRHHRLQAIILGIASLTIFSVSAQSQQYQVLHKFSPGLVNPYGKLIQGSDGNFYGTTVHSTGADHGTIFRMDPSGAVTTMHSFAGEWRDGALPYAGLTLGGDGNFYGTTY
ncbi:MAG: hypothetical protein QOK02_6546, partial [Mycobacterium sp.]|nr:hypothetical protein [Mycobacterium sp.]